MKNVSVQIFNPIRRFLNSLSKKNLKDKSRSVASDFRKTDDQMIPITKNKKSIWNRKDEMNTIIRNPGLISLKI